MQEIWPSAGTENRGLTDDDRKWLHEFSDHLSEILFRFSVRFLLEAERMADIYSRRGKRKLRRWAKSVAKQMKKIAEEWERRGEKKAMLCQDKEVEVVPYSILSNELQERLLDDLRAEKSHIWYGRECQIVQWKQDGGGIVLVWLPKGYLHDKKFGLFQSREKSQL